MGVQDKNLLPEKITPLVEMTKLLCTEETYSVFKDIIFKQSELAMGSSISPFLAELFMSHLETSLSKHKFFPRIWYCYVDDIFAIIKKSQLRSLLRMLNDFQPNIKFKYEEEQNESLPFLELLIIREGNKTEFKKSTNTKRLITNDSQHLPKHKQFVFQNLVHRLYNVPLII